MALTQQQKDSVKTEWNELVRLAQKFSKGTTQDLYVVDKKPLLKGAKVLSSLMGKIPTAAHTRGKQGHGKTNGQ